MKNKYIVWQNRDINEEDWRDDYRYCHDLSDEEMESVDNYDVYEWACRCNDDYLDDERTNLSVYIPNGILVIADLGLWDGRRHGYKEIISGNIADCLYDSDCVYCEWYCDKYDFRFTGSHHDGTNHYIYRTWADGLSEAQKDTYLEKLYNGKDTHEDMLKYTRSIRPYIADVYGWDGKKIKAERIRIF